MSYGYDADGRMISRTDPNEATTYTYDTRGDLTGVSTTATSTAGSTSSITYTYDLAGNMTSRTVNGVKTTYTYNTANEMTSMTTSDGALTNFAYDADGNRTDTWWHTNTANTAFSAHTHTVFDTSNRIIQSWTSTNATAGSSDANKVVNYSYSYQNGSLNTDLVQSITNNLASSNNVSTLSYDKGNRLIGATNWDGHSYTYTYDAEGNRLTTAVDGSTTQSLSFNSANEITSTGYAYDKAGRRISDPSDGTMTWNALGQMTKQVTSSDSETLAYAGVGQNELISQTHGTDTEKYMYGRDNEAGTPVLEQNNQDGTAFTWDSDAASEPIDFTGGGQSFFIIYDGLGRDVGAVNPSGQLFFGALQNYDPYGNPIAATSNTTAAKSAKTNRMSTAASGGTSETPWTTIGVQNSLNGSLFQRGARWNDTTTGTWTSVDPITKLNNPSNADPYAYAGDDPINNIDPAGQSWWNPTTWNWNTIENDASDVYTGISACVAFGNEGFMAAAEFDWVAGPEGIYFGDIAGGIAGCAFGVAVSTSGDDGTS